jgi:hypothetical protein
MPYYPECNTGFSCKIHSLTYQYLLSEPLTGTPPVLFKPARQACALSIQINQARLSISGWIKQHVAWQRMAVLNWKDAPYTAARYSETY